MHFSVPHAGNSKSSGAAPLEANHLDEALPIRGHAVALLERWVVVVGVAGLHHERLVIPAAGGRGPIAAIARAHVAPLRRTVVGGRLSMKAPLRTRDRLINLGDPCRCDGDHTGDLLDLKIFSRP